MVVIGREGWKFIRKPMGTILEQIVADKRRELAADQARVSLAELERQLAADPGPASRGFQAALQSTPFIRVIAEVKRRSPSAGAIAGQADAAEVAIRYASAGASCISVLTDGPHFGGSLHDLHAVRRAVPVPLLRKDFILERYQVMQARRAGADAVLLIAEILDDSTLRRLLEDIQELGMDALVECYQADNLQRVLDAGAKLVGINNRNLHTFEVRLEQTLDLAHRVPQDCILVSESGIKSRTEVEQLAAAGVKAILVGETLLRAERPGELLREWMRVRVI
jgi:indole-3-glycerol phosphate synthase